MPESTLGALEQAFEQARALPPADRDAYLRGLDARDGRFSSEVRALLAADEEIGALDRLAERMASVRGVMERAAALAGDQPAAPLPLPRRAGPYLIEDEIGRGGMGIVCRARDTRLGRDVALKIFPHPQDEEGDADGRMLAEARAASALDHPHICTIHDVGTLDDGRPYLAMAYYGGGTLADRIASGPLPVRDAVHVALQLAHALSCAHAAGIVHRDVKPRNVAFAEQGVTKLLDFGVAARRDGTPRGASAGTPSYMAPEQVRGESVDGRADVWALGVVLYEMLAGRRPFIATSRAVVRRAILFDTPTPPRALRRAVPRKVGALVARMMERQRDARPDAATVARELRGLLAEIDEARPRAFAWLRRHRGAVVTLLGGFTASSGPSGAVPASDPRVAEARARLETGDAQQVEAAIVLLRGVLARTPHDARAQVQLARAYLAAPQPGGARQGERRWVDSAFALARAAVAAAPADAEAHTVIGAIHTYEGRHAEAAAAHRRALRLAPRDARAMISLSHALAALDRHDEAFVWTERALREDAANPAARLRAVVRYASWNMVDEARHHLRVGLERSPAAVSLLWQGAMLELRAGDSAASRRYFDRYLGLVSPPEQVRMSAWYAFLRGDDRAARAYVDRVATVSSASYDMLLFGRVYRRTGARARGDALLRAQLAVLRQEDRRFRGRDEHVAIQLASLHAELGEDEAALRELARWNALGGLAGRTHFVWASGWGSVRQDPRFDSIVALADARYEAALARVRSRLRTEGLLPGE